MLFFGVHLERAQKWSGESPGTLEWLWRVFGTLWVLLRPTQKANKKFHFCLPLEPTTVNLNATIFLQNQSLNEQTGPANRVSDIKTLGKSNTGPI